VCAISSLTSTFAISSPDEFLCYILTVVSTPVTAFNVGLSLIAAVEGSSCWVVVAYLTHVSILKCKIVSSLSGAHRGVPVENGLGAC